MIQMSQVGVTARLAEQFCSKIVVMDINQRLSQAIKQSPLSTRKIADEMKALGYEVSHTTVNRWRTGKQLPRLDEAAALTRIARLDLVWILFGKGLPPWELTDMHRRILWLAEIIGLDRAAHRLASPGELEDVPLLVDDVPAQHREAIEFQPMDDEDDEDDEDDGVREDRRGSA